MLANPIREIKVYSQEMRASNSSRLDRQRRAPDP
jgi:hypothetical protein